MKRFTPDKVAELINIPLLVEKPHPTLVGVTVGERTGPLLELATLIANTLSETGTTLLNSGYPDLGTFVVEALNEAKKEGDKLGTAPVAEVVLERVSVSLETRNALHPYLPYRSSSRPFPRSRTWP